MFDSVGKQHRGSRARRGTALLLAVLATSGTLAVLSLLDVPPRPVAEPVPPMPPPRELFVPLDLARVGAPAAPKAKASSRARSTARALPAPAAPDAPVVDSVLSVATVPGADSGAGPGEGEGDGGGGCAGLDCGDGGGGPGHGTGGPVGVHHSDVRVRERVIPEWPEAARSLGMRGEDCVVRVLIDTAGLPAGVEVRRCPAVFQAPALRAAAGWRWDPYTVNGVAVAAQFDIKFRFERP